MSKGSTVVRMLLSDSDQADLDGVSGPAKALAMRVLIRLGEAMGAQHLIDISGAHIDSCLYHGQAGLDFAERLVEGGAEVQVPTTLNVSSLDLLHPELYRGDPATAVEARRLMQCYEDLGCAPTWTCAPYQRAGRPAFGDHVAWAESNAIVFANSVLGARTARYGDFVDICAAVTGRTPAASLHLDEHRLAQLVIDVSAVADRIDQGAGPALLGHVVGRLSGNQVPVVVGAPHLSEDQLKTLGSASASSGAVAMFHVVGSTPEAATLAEALGGKDPMHTLSVSALDLDTAWSGLSTIPDGRIGAISLGTPHYSITEFSLLVAAIEGHRSTIPFYVSTGREIVTELELRGWTEVLHDAGVQLVTDTCTYITPVMAPFAGAAMTDSPKWAYYAPGNLGVDVVFGTVDECVASAVAGHVVRLDGAGW